MPQPILQVDSFTDRPFAGNPAGVCILDRARDERWMQNVAREMNLSETAFLVPHNGGAVRGRFDLRWFTPAVEVDLCGHATLAAAHVLWEMNVLRTGEPARFETRSGTLTCAKRDDGWIEMDFPATEPKAAAAPDGLIDALVGDDVELRHALRGAYIGKTRFDCFVEMPDESAVRALRPDFGKLKRAGVRGTIVTARASTASYDFVSRFFAPGAGVDEDPVTGSAHCALAPFWARKLGKQSMIAYQASARGGVVRVELRDDRVGLIGQAVTVLRGELLT